MLARLVHGFSGYIRLGHVGTGYFRLVSLRQGRSG